MIIKEWRCCTDFESAIPICPVCKKIAKRVFLTPPRIGSVKEQNVNRILDDVLPAQNLANYSNATGYPKPHFSGIYQNDSGMRAGFGLNNLQNLIPDMPKDAPLMRMNVNTGAREVVNVESWAANLPKAVSAVNGSQIGVQRSGLGGRTEIAGRYKG